MGVPSDAPAGGASALSSVFTLLNSAVGAGVLSLPFAFREAGWAGCLLLTLAVAIIEAFTLYVLARYAEVTGSGTYSDLVRKMLGRKASLAMSLVLIIYSYGSATAYLIILGDCFQPMLAQTFGQVWWTERDLVIFVLATLFMLPLCFPRTLDAISGFSSVTAYALCVVVGMVVYRSLQALQVPHYKWSDVHAFTSCHTNLVAVFAELEEEPDLFAGGGDGASSADGEHAATSAHPQEDGTAPGTVSEEPAAAAASAPEAEQRIMLLHNPRRRFVRSTVRTPKLLGMVQIVSAARDDRLMQMARVLMGIIQIIHYPVNHFPARNATRDLLAQLTGRQLQSSAFNTAEVLGFFAATLGLSLVITDLGQVFKLIGGSCGSFFIFGMPGAFCLQYAYSKHITAREGLQESLLADEEAREVPRPGGSQMQYHVLASKLFWAGVLLLIFAVGLLSLTIYSLASRVETAPCGLFSSPLCWPWPPVITSHNNAQFHTLRPEAADLRRTPCDYCQEVVITLEKFVSDPQTQLQVVEYVEAAVCAGLPAQFAQICIQEVPVLVAQAAQQLQQALDPKDTCGVFGVCPGSAAQLLGLTAEQASSPFDCPVCKVMVVAFVQRLQDREQRQQIEVDMRAACDNLDPATKQRCLLDVTNLFAALDNLLHDVNPEGVCRVFAFCDVQSSGTATAASVPPALRTLGAALSQLATGGPARAAGANGDMCQDCKTIVMEAAAILQDPKTQTELLEYAKEGCTVFADFKDQCVQYVTLYGPLVFNMLISYLQPDMVCTRLGYCTAHPAIVVT
ncbi:putative sodium-coupled neutral amino acid transporter 7 [Chlorella vulgaris]